MDFLKWQVGLRYIPFTTLQAVLRCTPSQICKQCIEISQYPFCKFYLLGCSPNTPKQPRYFVAKNIKNNPGHLLPIFKNHAKDHSGIFHFFTTQPCCQLAILNCGHISKIDLWDTKAHLALKPCTYKGASCSCFSIVLFSVETL